MMRCAELAKPPPSPCGRACMRVCVHVRASTRASAHPCVQRCPTRIVRACVHVCMRVIIWPASCGCVCLFVPARTTHTPYHVGVSMRSWHVVCVGRWCLHMGAAVSRCTRLLYMHACVRVYKEITLPPKAPTAFKSDAFFLGTDTSVSHLYSHIHVRTWTHGYRAEAVAPETRASVHIGSESVHIGSGSGVIAPPCAEAVAAEGDRCR